ncbi:LacI family DNA-binding transcriptional regulator [Niallia sp. NCCP-28]|uniref:LacI family DNA-binding transcriptional regulator n=1 Tax=Niallia sp. NCCP-28 TaxID=2934712 RepID=UPI00207E778B|nr:LacI family DNA-binding transcriptional regulator [Niallia sp. NCCP-28]GKU82718.1 HTH-type transcriptional regulator DegA [Niallia sp. NCCP-28]
MKITIYDVAKKAGVSTATVSKIINNKGSISEKTKLKVQKVMDELQYQPSMIASALKGKSTYTIGLLIPDLSNPIFAEYAKYIEERGQELGFSLMICNTDANPDKELKYISLLKQKQVDGIIVAARFKNIKLLRDLIKEGFPLALIARDLPALPIDSVTVDDYLGGYQVTEYLLSLGHKNIGVVAEGDRSSKERIKGYQQALIDAGLTIDKNLTVVCDHPTREYAKFHAGSLLDLEKRPSAIFGCNDSLAIGVMQAAHERGLIIPNDLSVIGFDNTELSQVVVPSLSTVQQPLKDIGHHVVDLLTRKIEGKSKMTHRVVLLPDIIIRQSTMQIENMKN